MKRWLPNNPPTPGRWSFSPTPIGCRDEGLTSWVNWPTALDPENRAAWHLWALTEANQRDRTVRWLQVTQRFSDDLLAKAALADNAASLAAAEHDKEALALAIATYEDLWNHSPTEQQRAALETALATLRKYEF